MCGKIVPNGPGFDLVVGRDFATAAGSAEVEGYVDECNALVAIAGPPCIAFVSRSKANRYVHPVLRAAGRVRFQSC